MKKQLLISAFGLTIISSIFYSCTNDIGPDPLLDKNIAYTDKALLDSCKNSAAFTYYKNDPTTVHSGANGPHGAFKLKFNKIAFAALTDNNKLPVGQKFPNGSMVVKETQSNVYAFLYKREGTWIWGETSTDGSNISHSVNADHNYCISCHNFAAPRDYVASFNFY